MPKYRNNGTGALAFVVGKTKEGEPIIQSLKAGEEGAIDLPKEHPQLAGNIAAQVLEPVDTAHAKKAD